MTKVMCKDIVSCGYIGAKSEVHLKSATNAQFFV